MGSPEKGQLALQRLKEAGRKGQDRIGRPRPKRNQLTLYLRRRRWPEHLT